MNEILIGVVLAVLIIVVMLTPLLVGHRKRRVIGRLDQYQIIAEALLDGELPRAREALKGLIRADTEDISAYLRLAKVLRREGDLERSVAVYRTLKARSIAEQTLRQQVLEGLVEDLFRLGRYDEAHVEAEGLRQLDRRHPLIRQVELHEALARGDWKRALKAVDEIARAGRACAGPKAAQVRTHVAAMRAQEGQLRDGRRILEEALRDEPDYGPALLLLGDIRTRLDEHEKAIDAWKRLFRAHPQTAGRVIARIEKAYFEMGRFGDLAPLYDELSAGGGGAAPRLHVARARMELRKGAPEEALSILEDLEDPGSAAQIVADWHLFLMMEAGRHTEAHALLKERVEGELEERDPRACPACLQACEPTAVRCDNCGAWLPDPFAGSVH